MIICILIYMQGEDVQWISVQLECPNPTEDDWVGVFSPANIKLRSPQDLLLNALLDSCM